MSNEQRPLQPMGTQSRESVNMAEAMTPAAVLARQREYEEALAPLGIPHDDDSAAASGARGKVGDAASWAMGKTKSVSKCRAP